MLRKQFCILHQPSSIDFYRDLFQYIEETAIIDGENVVASYEEMKSLGLAWVMADFKLQRHLNKPWTSDFCIVTFPSEANPLYAIRAHNIYDKENVLIAQCFTRWVAMNIQSRSLSRIPSYLIERQYEREEDSLKYQKLRFNAYDQFEACFDYQITERDVDLNQHTNNTVYMLKCIETAIHQKIDVNCMDTFIIQFKHETYLNDAIEVMSATTANGLSVKLRKTALDQEVSLAEIVLR
jgi:medium-chain acyl-[acyl-carrier-protein] hydrolase